MVQQQDEKASKRYAFLMGANGPANLQLKYAEKDAIRLADALRENPCAFTQAECVVAMEPQKTLLLLQRLCRVCESPDLLVVHFSGHAFYDRNLYLMCNTTDTANVISSSIDIRSIKDLLRDCRAGKKILILDCSHAGAAHEGRGIGYPPEIDNILQATLQGSASVILSATSRKQSARELASLDGGAGFLSWALASACSTHFSEVSSDGISLSLADILRWLPRILNEVNSTLDSRSKIPNPYVLQEMEVGNSEIWFTPTSSTTLSLEENAISESQTSDSKNEQRLLTEDNHPILSNAIAGFQSDEPEGEDLLGVTKEVNALCSIIAANDVQPPLSIGLFGDWGSGKSFFMRKMRKRIEEIKDAVSKSKGKSAYCTHIVQMEFNAWHFVDTNLWASLTAEIFEQLDSALAVRQTIDNEQERQRLLDDTAKSRYVLAEELRRKEGAEAELLQSEQRLKQLQEEAALAANLSVLDVLRGTYKLAVQRPEVRAKIEEAAKELNLDKDATVTQQAKEQLFELRGLTGRIVALWLSVRNPRKRISWLMACLALVVIPFVVSGLLQFALASHIDKVASYLVGLILGVLASLGPFILPAKHAIEAIDDARRQGQKILEKERQQRLASLEEKRQQIKHEVDCAQKRFNDANEGVKRLEQQLDNLRADRQMSNFIKQRHLSSDYSAHLGIIARARQDFEELCRLLAQVREQESEKLKTDPKQIQESEGTRRKNDPASVTANLPRIDRIVLYIDDLDRCPEATVAEVLQAIHLLLAFPLFVVVVGVDSRWLVRSLQLHMKAFQTSLSNGHNVEQKEEHIHWESTPLSYLEKIFQIPYALRPMEQSGFDGLIKSLTEQRSSSSQPSTSYGTLSAVASDGGIDGNVSPPVRSNDIEEQKIESGEYVRLEFPAKTDAAEIDLNPSYLVLTDWERNYMMKLYSLIPSPRAVKRFVNLYRLIRASIDEDKQSAFVGNAQRGQYQAVLLLLAILTGYPMEATRMLGDLVEQKPSETWWEFIESYNSRTGTHASDNRATVMDRVTPIRAERWRDLLEKLGALRPLISNEQDCQDFVIWAVEISRYSFQSGRVVLLQPRPRTQEHRPTLASTQLESYN